MKTEIYTTPTCPYCAMTKELLDKQNISYVEHDVSVDEEARHKMVQKSGQLGVPVTVINGELIIGFDRKSLKEAVGKAKKAA